MTLSSTLLGFAMGTALGILLAVFIVHNRAADRSLMPWIVASQTIPILAIAPMIIVVLNAVGMTGLLPKAHDLDLSFLLPRRRRHGEGAAQPRTIQLDLMHTYNASPAQTFWKLRWPARCRICSPR